MIRYRRIRLRTPETEQDHVLQVQWRNSELAMTSFYSDTLTTMEGHMKWHEMVMSDPAQRFFMIDALTAPVAPYDSLKTPAPIGTTSLLKIDSKNRTAEYGRLLIGDERYLGGGFGYEAEYALMSYGFEHLALNRIWGEVLTYNHAVRKLHQKIGFKEEGILREHIFKQGKYEDIIIVGLLASDFRRLSANAGGAATVEEA